MRILKNVLDLVFDINAIKAFIKWPKFSFTSYKMISSLYMQGLRPKTIIDVGANVGQFGVACAKIFDNSHVYSFEANPKIFLTLQKNASRVNNLSVFNQALGDIQCKADFFVNSHSHSSSLLQLGQKHKQAFPNAIESKKIQVDVNTLDNLTSQIEFISPVLLKLDVQGFEFQVIEGARTVLNKIDFIIMELSYSPMYEGEKSYQEILEHMDALGFQAIRPVGYLEHPETKEILQMDWLFEKTNNSA